MPPHRHSQNTAAPQPRNRARFSHRMCVTAHCNTHHNTHLNVEEAPASASARAVELITMAWNYFCVLPLFGEPCTISVYCVVARIYRTVIEPERMICWPLELFFFFVLVWPNSWNRKIGIIITQPTPPTHNILWMVTLCIEWQPSLLRSHNLHANAMLHR